MKNFDFKRRSLFSFGPHLAGLVFMAIGLFTMVSPAIMQSDSSLEKASVVGASAFLLGLVVVTSYGGSLIDFERKRMREYFCLCGFRIGQWTALPDIKRISVVPVSYRVTNTPNGITPTLSRQVSGYRALLYASGTKPELAFDYPTKERAITDTRILSANLNAILELKLTERDGIFSG